jgi:outer membrane protein
MSALLAATISTARAQQPPIKIGVFDPQRVSEETDEGKKVQSDLTALRDKKQSELASKEKELNELQNQITTQGLSLSPEKRTLLERDIQKKTLELQQGRESARNEMQFELGAAQGKFQDKLLAVVEQFGRDQGFTLILDKSMAAYATQAIDVTTAIVDRFNAAVRPAAGAPGTPPPTAPPPKGKESGR